MKIYRFKCHDCGATAYEKIDKHTYQCSYCGFKEEVHREEKNNVDYEQQKQIHQEMVATQVQTRASGLVIKLIICIIFGASGVHKFIERKIISGLVYLFTFGLFGIGIVVDAIHYIAQLAHLPKVDFVQTHSDVEAYEEEYHDYD